MNYTPKLWEKMESHHPPIQYRYVGKNRFKMIGLSATHATTPVPSLTSHL